MDDIDEQLEQHLDFARETPDPGSAYNGPIPSDVSINWLAQVFRMHPNTVRDRLRDCPAKTNKARGGAGVQRTIRYDLPTAAAFLVKPKMDTAAYLKAAKKGDLPPALNQTMWDALLKRQKWEENAGDLWRTEAIREVLSGSFQTIKFTMQLWVDTLERQTGVTREQRELLTGMVDALQGEIYESLVDNAANSQTGPQLTELETVIGEDKTATELIAAVEENDAADREIEDMV